MRNQFSEIANQEYDKLLSTFEVYFKAIEDIYDNYEEYISSKITELSNEISQYFIDRNIFNFELKNFIESYLKPVFIDYFSQVDDQYLEIIMTTEELDEYKTKRRQYRSKFHENSLEGHTKAFAANLAIGALHGTFNIGAKMMTSAFNFVKKSNIYKSEDNRKLLAEGLKQTIYQLHIAIARAINDYFIEPIFNVLSKEYVDRAKRLFTNVKNGKAPTDKIQYIDIGILL